MSFEDLHERLKKISTYAVWISGGAILAIALLVTADVILRRLFVVTITGAADISGYLFAAATAIAYSFALLHRVHMRIDAVYMFASRPIKAALDVLGVMLLTLFVSVVTYYAAHVLMSSWSANSRSISILRTPLWIPQLVWFSGLLLFSLSLIFLSTYALLSLFKRNWRLVNQIAGIPSIDEVIEEDGGKDG